MPERLIQGVDYDVAPYDRVAHGRFVVPSWCTGARHSPDRLARYLVREATQTIVAHAAGAPAELLGWACVTGRAVVWVYVKRTLVDGLLRRRKLGRALLAAAGADLVERTPCLFWSPDAAEIAMAGRWPIVYAPWGAG